MGNLGVPLSPLVVIVGATATGKTGLSLDLAERIGRVQILSADSRQVYRGMDIGTAKVTAADRQRVPHHGIDLVDPDEQFSAADYQRYARERPEMTWLAGIPEVRNAIWIDLPTSHWPMWSRPAEVAAIIGDIAARAGGAR